MQFSGDLRGLFLFREELYYQNKKMKIHNDYL
jgi:hypothetical protein